MELMEAIKNRHAVRSYTDQKIEGNILDDLRAFTEACNQEGGLHIQLCLDEPAAFSGMMARYGKFRNVRNYIALVGKAGDDLDEKCGYYGEKIALHAQQLGLNTCWVAMSFSKGKAKKVLTIAPVEKLVMVITLGYGETQGVPHKSKPIEELISAGGEMPVWFLSGVEASRLAPTAMNQQKFCFSLSENKVKAEARSGVYTKTDLGIAKYHFEIGAGESDWAWA